MSSREQHQWYVRLLGGFEVESSSGAARVTLYDRKQDFLLACLALEPNRAHLRRDIGRLLWPDHDTPDARNRLTEVLFRLRRDLEEAGVPPDSVLGADKHSIRLLSVRTDLQDLEEVLDEVQDPDLSTEGRDALLAEARSIYGSGLLPHLQEGWVSERRRQIEAALGGVLVPVSITRRQQFQSEDTITQEPLTTSMRQGILTFVRDSVALVERFEPEMKIRAGGPWIEEIDSIYPELATALDWALGHNETHLAARLAGTLAPYWHHLGQTGSGRIELQRVIDARPQATTVADAKVWHGAGSLAYLEGDYEDARRKLERAVELWTVNDDSVGIARAVGNLALVRYSDGELEKARELLDQSLRILKRVAPDSPHLLSFLRNAALVEREASHLDRARALLEELVSVSAALDDESAEGWAHVDLMVLDQMEGRWDDAHSHGLRAVQIFSDARDRRGKAQALLSHGYTLMSQQLLGESARQYEQALGLFRSMNDYRGTADSLRFLGQVYSESADRERAAHYYRQARTILHSLNDFLTVKEIDEELKKMEAEQPS